MLRSRSSKAGYIGGRISSTSLRITYLNFMLYHRTLSRLVIIRAANISSGLYYGASNGMDCTIA